MLHPLNLIRFSIVFVWSRVLLNLLKKIEETKQMLPAIVDFACVTLVYTNSCVLYLHLHFSLSFNSSC